jgi:hypothetical protein
MANEDPIEILYLPGQLRSLFTSKLPEAKFGNPDERESNFLTRALAAFAIHKLGGCPLDDAAKSIVDGGGDGGIDAIFYSSTTQILWVVQSKYIKDGRGEPALGDVSKFKDGLTNLLLGNFEPFQGNEAWQKIIPQLQILLDNTALQVRAALVYSGVALVSEDRRHQIEDLVQRFSDDSDYLKFGTYNLTTVHDWLIGADKPLGVQKVQLKISSPGWLTQPYETIFGRVLLKEIADLYAQHGRNLVISNIRYYKGNTDVNSQISKTIQEEPENFFYLNNGLTAYCSSFEVRPSDRGKANYKHVTAYGISIINGAQTLGSIAKYFETDAENLSKGYVFIKLISLSKCEDDIKFSARITRSSNFQNQIGLRDFIAADEQHERIANQLKLGGISYHYKDDAEAPSPDATNFTLTEATTAGACLAREDPEDYCAQIIANRKLLWSMDEIYPPEKILCSRYAQVFNPIRSARTIWRAVQMQRIVIKAMQEAGRTETGARKAFFENARWVLLNVLFIKLRLEQGNALSLTAQEESTILQSTQYFAEKLWNVCETKGYVTRQALAGGSVEFQSTRHFRSVFSSPADCRILRGALLAELAQSQAPMIAESPDSISQ